MNNLFANPGAVTVVLILAFSLAALAGYGFCKFSGDQPQDEAESETAMQGSPGRPREPEPSSGKPALPPKFKPPKPKWEEIAHLWRDPRDGRLIFQIENEYYKRGADLTPADRKILLKVVMDFYRWLEPPSPAKPRKAAGATRTPDEGLPLVMVPPQESSEGPRGFSPAVLLSDALKSVVPAPPPQTPSIVTQIDAVLQEKIKEANMQKWAIRLVELPDRGMVVLVGLEQYDGIDDVPYDPVREIIRASVEAWEQQIDDEKPAGQRSS